MSLLVKQFYVPMIFSFSSLFFFCWRNTSSDNIQQFKDKMTEELHYASLLQLCSSFFLVGRLLFQQIVTLCTALCNIKRGIWIERKLLYVPYTVRVIKHSLGMSLYSFVGNILKYHGHAIDSFSSSFSCCCCCSNKEENQNYIIAYNMEEKINVFVVQDKIVRTLIGVRGGHYDKLKLLLTTLMRREPEPIILFLLVK